MSIFTAAAHANQPLVIVELKPNLTLGSLLISAYTVWDKNELLEDRERSRLRQENLYLRGQTESLRQSLSFKLAKNRLRVELVFPEPQTGRELNASTRVALKLYENDKLILHTEHLGQPSEEFVALPANGFLGRPLAVLYRANRHNKITTSSLALIGRTGGEEYYDGVGQQLGFEWQIPDELFQQHVINDQWISHMLQKSHAKSPNN